LAASSSKGKRVSPGAVAGSAFFTEEFSDEEFIAEFDIRIVGPAETCGDGLAFIVNTGGPLDVCGREGSNMGFRNELFGPAAYPGFAFAFDTWENPSEPGHNWVGLVDLDALGGTVLAGKSVAEEFCSRGTFHATIVGAQGEFAVYLENSAIGMDRREILYHVVEGFVPRAANFGFSAATGGAFARQSIDDFELYIPVTEPPRAEFTAVPRTGPVPLAVAFSSVEERFVDEILWEFGDGATSDQPSPTHVYDIPGMYAVRLTLSGPGGSDTLVLSDHILAYDPAETFIRGDANGDDTVDVSDGIFVLLWSFSGTVTTTCEDSLDANDDAVIGITDAIGILQHIFLGGPAPAAPYPDRSVDPTADLLTTCRRES
jgi:hypothetical protein